METREIILDILQEMHEDIDYEKEKAFIHCFTISNFTTLNKHTCICTRKRKCR